MKDLKLKHYLKYIFINILIAAGVKEKDIMFRSAKMKPLLVQKDHYFVIEDNHTDSQDSLVFGLVPQKYIYGKNFLQYWPFPRLGKVE